MIDVENCVVFYEGDFDFVVFFCIIGFGFVYFVSIDDKLIFGVFVDLFVEFECLMIGYLCGG